MEEDLKIFIETFRSNRNFDDLILVLKKDVILFRQIVGLSVSMHEYPFPEYSSWLLSNYAKKYPEDFEPFLNDIIRCLEGSTNQTVLRNLLGILRFVKFSEEELMSRILDLCIKFLSNNSNKVALQVYAIQVLIPIVKIYPELKEELTAIINLNYKEKSPAFQAARRNFFKP
jgi:hypothetical protein